MNASPQFVNRRFTIKRVYDPPSDQDGVRVLIDRLWPRGLSKERAKVDHWLKDLAPSTALRKWFQHDPDRWQEFQTRYARELDRHPESIKEILAMARQKPVTLLYGAANPQYNHAIALKAYLARYHE